MLKHEKLSSTNTTKSGAHKNLAKVHENEHTPGLSSVKLLFGNVFSEICIVEKKTTKRIFGGSFRVSLVLESKQVKIYGECIKLTFPVGIIYAALSDKPNIQTKAMAM